MLTRLYGPICRALTGWLGLLLLAVGVHPVSTQAQTSTASEDDIRAAMISHLPLFVEWPSSKLDQFHTTFNVCLLGSDPLRGALETQLRNKTLLSMPIVIQKVTVKDHVEQCHILYVGAGSRSELPALLPELTRNSVLVVSERPLAVQKGQTIGLPVEDTHIRIEINLNAAQASNLVISSRLLHLASVVAR